MSEPVSQATLRIVKVFWGLSASLAYKRHFPAIDWLQSYSLYSDRLGGWYDREIGEEWNAMRAEAMRILQEEAGLNEIVRLVGMDALGGRDKITMDTAKSIREDYLHQNAFHETDTYTSVRKQMKMLKLILDFDHRARRALVENVDVEDILELDVKEKIGRSKYISEENIGEFDAIEDELAIQFENLIGQR